MSRAPYLTKSRFVLATECPRKLHYTGKPAYANSRDGDEFLQSLAEGGEQVGAYARFLFPDGIEITAAGHDAQVQDTADHLTADAVTLFEAAFRHDRCFVRTDILEKRGRTVRLIEVKAKAIDSTDANALTGIHGGIVAGIRPYLLDLAFQTMVVRQALPSCDVRAFLMLPDKARRAAVQGLNGCFPIRQLNVAERRVQVGPRPGLTRADVGDSILTERDVTDLVDRLLQQPLTVPGAEGTLPALATAWATAYEHDVPVAPPVGAQCRDCEFRTPTTDTSGSGFTECWSDAFSLSPSALAAPLSLDVWFAGTNAGRWLKSGKIFQRDLTLTDLAAAPVLENGDGLTRVGRQWMEVSGTGVPSDGLYFHRERAAAEMASWRYPLNFIDFETARAALPYHRGDRPFGVAAFQFSHHVLHDDGTVIHAHDFLATDPDEPPNMSFLRALERALGTNDGTLLMWSPYENTILVELHEQLADGTLPADDAAVLQSFIRRITTYRAGRGRAAGWEGPRAFRDMCKLAERTFFYRPSGASTSIKRVLPAVLRASTWLRDRYSRPIYGGGAPNSLNYEEAMTWWMPDQHGVPVDPYTLLPPVFADLPALALDDERTLLNHGGAASLAYARLQSELMTDDRRAAWNRALRKYCELDTLAMVMIAQAWQAWL